MDLVLKADLLMGPVAEGFVGGVAAAAQADGGAPGEAEGLALRVEDFEIAFDADGAVAVDGDFGGGHGAPSVKEKMNRRGRRVTRNARLRDRVIRWLGDCVIERRRPGIRLQAWRQSSPARR